MLSARFGAARLLDVARWAESGSVSGKLHLETALTGPDGVIFAPGGVAETQAVAANTCINELVTLVGTSHASVISLRLYRLNAALRGAVAHTLALPQPRPRAELAAVVRRLLGVKSGTAAATMPASALLATEVAALAATLRRAKRLAALSPIVLSQLVCVMNALGGLDDPSTARCVRACGCVHCALVTMMCACCAPAVPAALPAMMMRCVRAYASVHLRVRVVSRAQRIGDCCAGCCWTCCATSRAAQRMARARRRS
jgi:hypothetical protein